MKNEEEEPIPQPTESEAIVAALRDAPGARQVAPVPLPVDQAAEPPPKKAARDEDLVAKARVSVAAPLAKVWEALVTPSQIKRYMFGADVRSDFKKGSPITWQGEYQGKRYQDKGVITQVEPQKLLAYTHFSPLSGEADRPENYHNVTIALSEEKNREILVALTQDHNRTEEAMRHSADNWQRMLDGLQKVVEDAME